MLTDGIRAVAVDFDGTLVHGPEVDADVLQAVRDARRAGRRVVLVTGRILTEMWHAFPGLEREFDAVVAENGAVLAYGGQVRDLTAPVDPALAAALARRDVRVRQGRVLLAGSAADETTVLEEVARLQLDCHPVRNRSELMVLPVGVTKATGLVQALDELSISPHSTIGVGDAENDHALLDACELGVAVANADDELKSHADLVLDEPDGTGVAALLRGPLLSGEQRLAPRHWQVELGHTNTGDPVTIPASQVTMVLTGGSFSGKSHTAGLVVEQLIRLGYSVVVLDTEGDHVDLAALPGVTTLGGTHPLPGAEEVGQLVTHHAGGLVLDPSRLPDHEQQAYLHAVTEQLIRHRAETGLPHWVVVEEAHVLLAHEGPAYGLLGATAIGLCAVTYRPHDLVGVLHDAADAVVATVGTGLGAEDTTAYLAELTGQPIEELHAWLARGPSEEALLVRTDQPEPTAFEVAARRIGHVRHQRKYAEGALPNHLGFVFRIADLDEFRAVLGCCSETTIDFHTRRQDFSRWVGDVLGDETLAASVAQVEAHHHAESALPETTRQALLAALHDIDHLQHQRTESDDTLPGHLGFVFHAPNLGEFRAVLGCCSEATLDFHSRRHDLSRWVGNVLGDEILAARIADIERLRHAKSAAPSDTRAALLGAIDARYTTASVERLST